jgi:signal peptidase I
VSETQKEWRETCYDLLQMLVAILVLYILLSTFVGRITRVDGSSMYPTLHDQELMVVRSIGYQPEQGDVVVLTQKSYRSASLVKRIIALGGQTVRIDYESNTVYVDGVPLDEPYINLEEEDPMEERPADWTDELTVPEGYVFVMGDNRNHSGDSREPEIGVVAEGNIIGKCVLVGFPFRKL